MQGETRMSSEPGHDVRRLVGATVVQDEVKGEAPGHRAVDLFEEAHKVRAAVLPRHGAQHLAGRHIEGGVEAGGAVAGVIVRPSRDLLVTEGGRGSRRRSERIPPLWALSSEVGGDGGGNPTLPRPPAGNTPDLAGPGGWRRRAPGVA